MGELATYCIQSLVSLDMAIVENSTSKLFDWFLLTVISIEIT
jgi:hypothetical protein